MERLDEQTIDIMKGFAKAEHKTMLCRDCVEKTHAECHEYLPAISATLAA